MPLGGTKRAALVAVALLAACGAAGAADSPAHRLADKFAGEAAQSEDARRKADEQRKKEAERQAQDALREQARKRAEATLRADRERERQRTQPITANKPAAPSAPSAEPSGVTPAAQKPPELLAEERDMLARARREEDQRRVAEERARAEAEARRKIEQAESAKRQIEQIILGSSTPPATEASPIAPEAPKIAAEPVAHPVSKAPAPAPKAEEAAPVRTAEPTPDADARRRAAVASAMRTWRKSSERLQARARAEAEAKALAAAAKPGEASAPVASAPPPPPPPAKPEVAAASPSARGPVAPAVRTPDVAPAPERGASPSAPKTILEPQPALAEQPAAGTRPSLEPRVTILIAMQPGHKGIRRHNKLADPLLCLNGGCYVSAGAAAPARFMPRRTALGIGNTLGARAGACRNRLTCVFRAVDVQEFPLIVQPVDMRMVKHDRRRIQAVAADSQCRSVGDSVTCAKPFVADDYVMWVLPETLATAAGPTALERALADGLPVSKSAALAGSVRP